MKNKSLIKSLALSLYFVTQLIACGGGGGGGGGGNDGGGGGGDTADTEPAAFSFLDHNEAALDTDIVSNTIQIIGINQPSNISISGGEYTIDGGSFTSADGTVSSNQLIQLRQRSSNTVNTATDTTLTIGGVEDTFTVTTAPLRFIEAENTSLVGNTMINTEASASNGEVVNNLLGSGSSTGIQITDTPYSVGIRLTYSSTAAGNLSLDIDGMNAGQFALADTGGLTTFATSEVDRVIGQGATVTISIQGSDIPATLDFVEFIPSPLQEVTTLANTGILPPPGSGGTYGGDGVSVAANGDIYISGGASSGSIIRVTPQGNVSTFATGFNTAQGSDFDSAGNLFVADYQGNQVRKVAPDGTVTTFASNLNGPASVYVDASDNVIVGLFGANGSGTGATVLSFTPSGTQTTLATGGGLQDVIGVTGDENGEIYAGNFQNGQMYRVTGGNVVLLADGNVEINQIDYSRGYIYTAGNPSGGRIGRINTSTGEAEVFSGSSLRQTTNGPVESAEYVGINSLGFSPDGNILYIFDTRTGDLRKITTP